MELRHIRYFLAVAEERSFTGAAQRLGIGQPPLSQQIRDLERELGVTLFHRLPRGADLTEAGQAFYRSVRGLPNLVDVAAREAQYVARGETGSLQVGFTSAAVLYRVVQSSIRNFRRAYPNVELGLEEANTSTLERRLAERGLDVVFVHAGEKHLDDFRVVRVAEERMVAALPADHPLSGRQEIELSQLQNDPFILTPRHVGPPFYDTVVTACRDAGFEPRPGQVAPQFLSVISLVSVGLGVSVVPTAMRALHLSGCRYVELRGGPLIQLSVACRRDNRSKVLGNFLEHVTGVP